MSDNRREFLKKSALLGLGSIAGSLLGGTNTDPLHALENPRSAPDMPFTLPPLQYGYDALEPFIDKQTMEIHHDKHHKAYVDKLNGADYKLLNLTVSDEQKCLLITTDSLALIRNNLGGHYNHSLFWQLLKPNPTQASNLPDAKLAEAINLQFKSFDDFKREFSDKALKIFGSGWCWLIIDENKKLRITTTPNQDNPLMQVAAEKGQIVLALDVWEHAYYLKYQNKRADYIGNWWNIINWQKAEVLFSAK
ncbi:MAG: superoxide dismutase [Bacteroidota bacterium]